MSDPSGIFTFLAGNIDGALGKFVTQTSVALSAGIAPLVVTGITMWIMLYGMASMRGEVQDPVMGFVKSAIRLSFIFGIALGAGIYQSMIVETVYAFQSGLGQIFSPDAANIFAALDKFDNKSTEHAMVIMGRGYTALPMGGYLDICAGLILLLTNAVLLALCGGFALLAKVSLTFVLALGPLFIVALAFTPINKFFDAWLSKVLNYVLMTVCLGAVLTFALTISSDYIDTMIANTNNEGISAMSDAFGLVMVNGALLVVTYHLPQLVAGLTGGTPLSGAGLASFVGNKIFGGGGKSSGGKDGGEGGGKGGGSVSNNSSTSTNNTSSSGSSSGSSGGGSVPAYRRATLDRLHAPK